MSGHHRPAASGRLDRLLDRLSFAPAVGDTHAEMWRQNVLDLGLKVGVVLGSVVYVPSVWAAVGSEKWGVAVVDSVALAAVVALHLVRSPGTGFRSVAFSLVMYALGVALLVEVGPVSQIYLFGFSIIATLLLGVRVGVLAVALNAASLLAVGLAGHGSPAMALNWHTTDPAAWVVVTLNFVLVNVLLVLAVGLVTATLERIARREREARDQLERERAELVAATRKLRARFAHERATEPAGLDCSPDSRWFVYSARTQLCVVDTDTARCVTPAVHEGKAIQEVALTTDGQHLLTVDRSQDLAEWDTRTWQPVRRYTWKIGPLTSVAVSPDGCRAAAGSRSGVVLLWDLEG